MTSLYIGSKEGVTFYEGMKYSEEILLALDFVCEKNIDDIKPVFKQEVEEWANERKELFLSGDLIFESYSTEREQELNKIKNDFGRCHYQDFERVGDWLVVNSTSRDYCHLSGGGGGACPYAKISHTEFIGFLLSNPNLETLPYLAGYLLFFVIAIGGLIYLYKRDELKKFFKPSKIHVIIVAVIGLFSFLIFLVLMDLIQVIFWVIGAYIFASIINYVSLRKKK